MPPTKDITKLKSRLKLAASTKSGNIHIIPTWSKWAIKKEGTKKVYSLANTLEEAIESVNRVKTSKKIIIHKKDGSILEN